MKSKILYIVACIFLVLALSGCMAPTEIPANVTQTATSELTKTIAEKTYKSWEMWPGKGELYPGKEPHGSLLTTYVNDIALSAIQGKKGRLPTGSIIVKENYDADKKLVAITSMTKIVGYDSAHNDWFWLSVSADGNISAQGKVQGCINCHNANSTNDYIFTGSLK